MNGEYLSRDKIITEWFFQDWIGDKSHLPDAEDVFIFMKILIDFASINGELSEQERKYILGRAAIFGMNELRLLVIDLYIFLNEIGASQEMLNKLQAYQPDPVKDINKAIQNADLPHVKKTRMGLIYNLFRILGSDHDIHPKQLETIRLIAKKLGATDQQIDQMQNLYEEEQMLRQKRALLFFPHGFNDALIEYQKLH